MPVTPAEQYQRQESKAAPTTKKPTMQWQRIDKKTNQPEQKASSSSEPDYLQEVEQELQSNSWGLDYEKNQQQLAE
jgi:hypothetical protein